MKMTVFLGVAPCRLMGVYRRFRVLTASVIRDMKQKVSTSETSHSF
jgi:hypothetical protein